MGAIDQEGQKILAKRLPKLSDTPCPSFMEVLAEQVKAMGYPMVDDCNPSARTDTHPGIQCQTTAHLPLTSDYKMPGNSKKWQQSHKQLEIITQLSSCKHDKSEATLVNSLSERMLMRR